MRPIPGCEGFFATRNGRILSTRTGKISEISAGEHKGYLHVWVRYGLGRASRRREPVHKLVLMAWHGEKPFPEAQCRHLNGNAFDNRPCNLAWGTSKENRADAIRHGTAACLRTGERHTAAKLSNVDVAEIRRRGSDGERKRDLARKFRVSAGHVGDILLGRTRVRDTPWGV